MFELSRQSARANRGAPRRQHGHGVLRELPQEQAGIERLPDLSLLMDRRHFIKLTAITACGNPENQVIRFIPDEDLVPGIATWKPSICPLCSAGCGVIARVMEGDAEVFRNGQAGVIRMGLAKKLEGNPEDAISQGKLCARGQAAIQVTYHPDRLDKPRKRTGERGSGQYAEITWEEAIKELIGKLNELSAANDQASLAFLTKPRRGRRLELIAQLL